MHNIDIGRLVVADLQPGLGLGWVVETKVASGWLSLGEEGTHLFWQGLQEWGIKETRGNAVDPDTLAGEVPGQGKGHPDDSTLASRVGCLAHLAIKCRH